jgi:hypothetical protein
MPLFALQRVESICLQMGGDLRAEGSNMADNVTSDYPSM